MTKNKTKNKNSERILIIGAGLAGLAAAKTLQQQGHQVMILEARNRWGGRIWTSHRWKDIPLDLGASWIHGVQGNPITELANELQAKRLITSYERAATYNAQGQLLSKEETTQLERIRKQIQQTLRQAQNIDPDRSIRQTIASLEKTFESEPQAQQFKQFLNFCLSGELEQEYSGSAHRLSTHWFDASKEFKGNDALFVKGFEVITQFLASNLPITLSQTVKKIQWQPEVRVTTQTQTWHADRVVVTVPLGVLQHHDVEFTPALPTETQHAIQTLGMGVLNKCYLRFEKAFWSHDVDWLEYIAPQHGEWTEWVSFQRAAKQPILLGFNAADQGLAIEAWSDQQVVASAMQTLKTLFGSKIPHPIDHQITRWASDPFARGSYSYYAVGSSPAMRATLAHPLGNRLYFAGEATSQEHFGTAHGAYLTGLSAAQNILMS